MKAVVHAGGLGTPISEETHLEPKPMVEIGGRPILWEVLQIDSTRGINLESGGAGVLAQAMTPSGDLAQASVNCTC